MFLTQNDLQLFTRNRSHSGSKTLHRTPFKKSTNYNPQFPKKHESLTNFIVPDLKKIILLNSTQKKWNKIVELYNMPKHNDKIQMKQLKIIRAGVGFYSMLANTELMKNYKLRLKFPQTFLQISGELYEIKTNSITGQVQSGKIKRQAYLELMQSYLLQQIKKLQSIKIKYKKYYDYRYNPFAPVIVTKIGQQLDQIFQVDIQNYKIFTQRRSRPSNNKIIQRFIYPRNMRAIILRLCYQRKDLGQQKQQFYAYRFQNIDNIFHINKKNSQIYETYKLQSTISATYDRQNKIQYSKLSNIKGLYKYIEPTKQLIKFLQNSQKVRVNKIYVDYLVDLYDEPWLINIKYVEYKNIGISQLSQNINNVDNAGRNKYNLNLHIAGNYGICRLCSIEYLKINLRKSISNKMLHQFLLHLKKRLKITQYANLFFINDIVQKNVNNYITFEVCDCCYKIVAEEYKLIQCQRKLASICNIETKMEMGQYTGKIMKISEQNQLKQWRLMFYFVDVQNIPQYLLKNKEELILKYKLGVNQMLQHSWKLELLNKTNTGTNNFHGRFNAGIQIKKLKVYYFYSQTLDIDQFLKQTQVSIHLATSQQKIIAKGSTSILSCFGRKFQQGQCLRQISSILLFYNNGEYCEMTLKVGLICDGTYHLGENVPLIELNKVYLTDNSYSNSNHIPKQWLQAIGVNEDIYIPQAQYQQIINPKFKDKFLQFQQRKQKDTTKKGRKSLARKSLRFYKNC